MASQDSPKVFVSYSHDSDQHKAWVRMLAEKLRGDGVDITLDQWDIDVGDDVTSFMEEALSSCNYVLIVCSEQYVKKANTLKGGVGYERMIITAEIAQDLKSHKFIPLIRNTVEETLPRFLGPRIYVDFRTGDFDGEPYDTLLRTLLNQRKFTRPPLGKSPYLRVEGVSANTDKNTSTIAVRDPWCYHWHPTVHEYCGYKLYLILVRFATGSIIMKESVLKDLQDAGVSNYMIFPLYSQWDVLIRAWADEKTAAKLKIKLIENKDLHKDRQPEFLVVHKHTHFPETNTLPDEPRELERILDLTSLKDVQDRGDVSQDFKRLKDAGLILDDIVSFDPDRIQFYITIRSIDGLNNTSLKRLKELVANSIKVRNRSIYTTGGSSIGAVIKAQTDNYYVINDFLQAIARELESDGVITETMLVANRAVRMGKRIDFSRAEEHVIEHELQKLIPEIGAGSKLSYKDCVSLVAKYVGVRKRLHEDKDGVLVKLIRAKARDSAEEVGSIIFSFFPAFEDKLRRKLVPLAQRLYGDEWQKELDVIKTSEGVQAKKVAIYTLGDLCIIYKKIVLDKRIIDIAPLSDKEFEAMMDTTPVIRNKFAHNAPDLNRWESLFSFCSDFIPIHWRLLDAIEK